MRAFRPAVAAWFKVLCVALLLGSCAPIISEYSLDAYKTATSLKAETIGLIDKSGDKIAAHKPEIDALTVKIDAAYEFAAGMPANEIAAAEWQKLRDPAGGLYGGFLRIWREGPLPPAFRDDKKKQIGAAFDQIICLEINKKEAQRCGVAAAPKG